MYHTVFKQITGTNTIFEKQKEKEPGHKKNIQHRIDSSSVNINGAVRPVKVFFTVKCHEPGSEIRLDP